MKKVIAIILLMSLFNSCANIKVNNAIKTVIGVWVVWKYEKDAVDQTIAWQAIYSDYKLSFFKDGTETETYNNFGVTPVYTDGIYIFDDTVDHLTLSDENGTRAFSILTLRNDELDIELQHDTITEVYYLQPLQ